MGFQAIPLAIMFASSLAASYGANKAAEKMGYRTDDEKQSELMDFSPEAVKRDLRAAHAWRKENEQGFEGFADRDDAARTLAQFRQQRAGGYKWMPEVFGIKPTDLVGDVVGGLFTAGLYPEMRAAGTGMKMAYNTAKRELLESGASQAGAHALAEGVRAAGGGPVAQTVASLAGGFAAPHAGFTAIEGVRLHRAKKAGTIGGKKLLPEMSEEAAADVAESVRKATGTPWQAGRPDPEASGGARPDWRTRTPMGPEPGKATPAPVRPEAVSPQVPRGPLALSSGPVSAGLLPNPMIHELDDAMNGQIRDLAPRTVVQGPPVSHFDDEPEVRDLPAREAPEPRPLSLEDQYPDLKGREIEPGYYGLKNGRGFKTEKSAQAFIKKNKLEGATVVKSRIKPGQKGGGYVVKFSGEKTPAPVARPKPVDLQQGRLPFDMEEGPAPALLDKVHTGEEPYIFIGRSDGSYFQSANEAIDAARFHKSHGAIRNMDNVEVVPVKGADGDGFALRISEPQMTGRQYDAERAPAAWRDPSAVDQVAHNADEVDDPFAPPKAKEKEPLSLKDNMTRRFEILRKVIKKAKPGEETLTPEDSKFLYSEWDPLHGGTSLYPGGTRLKMMPMPEGVEITSENLDKALASPEVLEVFENNLRYQTWQHVRRRIGAKNVDTPVRGKKVIDPRRLSRKDMESILRGTINSMVGTRVRSGPTVDIEALLRGDAPSVPDNRNLTDSILAWMDTTPGRNGKTRRYDYNGLIMGMERLLRMVGTPTPKRIRREVISLLEADKANMKVADQTGIFSANDGKYHPTGWGDAVKDGVAKPTVPGWSYDDMVRALQDQFDHPTDIAFREAIDKEWFERQKLLVYEKRKKFVKNKEGNRVLRYVDEKWKLDEPDHLKGKPEEADLDGTPEEIAAGADLRESAALNPDVDPEVRRINEEIRRKKQTAAEANEMLDFTPPYSMGRSEADDLEDLIPDVSAAEDLRFTRERLETDTGGSKAEKMVYAPGNGIPPLDPAPGEMASFAKALTNNPMSITAESIRSGGNAERKIKILQSHASRLDKGTPEWRHLMDVAHSLDAIPAGIINTDKPEMIHRKRQQPDPAQRLESIARDIADLERTKKIANSDLSDKQSKLAITKATGVPAALRKKIETQPLKVKVEDLGEGDRLEAVLNVLDREVESPGHDWESKLHLASLRRKGVAKMLSERFTAVVEAAKEKPGILPDTKVFTRMWDAAMDRAPEPVRKLIHEKQHRTRTDVYAAHQKLRHIQDIRDSYADPDEFNRRLTKVLTTKGAERARYMKGMPEEARDAISALIEDYGRLTEESFKRGILDKGLEATEAGRHLRTVYGAHYDKRAFIERHKQFIETSDPATDGLAQAAVKSLMDSGHAEKEADAVNMLFRMAGVKPGKQKYDPKGYNMRTARQRDHITPEVAAFLERIDDPVFRMHASIKEAANDVYTYDMLMDLGKNAEVISETGKDGYIRLDLKTIPDHGKHHNFEDRRWGPLAGKYVREDVYKALTKDHYDSHQFVKAWKTGLSVWKSLHVVYSPATLSRNIFGNGLFAQLGGMPLHQQAAALPDAIREVRAGMKGKRTELFKEAERLGLFSGGYLVNDLDMLHRGAQAIAARKESPLVGATLNLRRFVSDNPVGKSLGDFYEMSEDVSKYMLLKHYMDKGWTEAGKHVKPTVEEAVKRVEKFLFNYGDVPDTVRFMRNTAWPFISFPYMATKALSTVAVEAAKGDTNAMVRLAGFVGTAYAIKAGAEAAGYDIDLSSLVPFVDMIGMDGEGDPTSEIKQVMLPGGPMTLPLELATGKTVGAMAEDQTGHAMPWASEIRRDDLTPAENARRTGMHAYRSMTPGLAPGNWQGMQVAKMIRGEKSPALALLNAVFGIKLEPNDAEHIGMRIDRYDRALYAEQKRFDKRMAEAKSDLDRKKATELFEYKTQILLRQIEEAAGKLGKRTN